MAGLSAASQHEYAAASPTWIKGGRFNSWRRESERNWKGKGKGGKGRKHRGRKVIEENTP